MASTSRLVIALVGLPVMATACTAVPVEDEPVAVPSGYQLLEEGDAAVAVPEDWLVTPEAASGERIIIAAAGDFQDGIPRIARLSRYDEAESSATLLSLFRESDPGGGELEEAGEQLEVPGAVETIHLQDLHEADTPPGDPPLRWVSDHLLAVTSEGEGYTLTVQMEEGRDDPDLRATLLKTLHVR